MALEGDLRSVALPKVLQHLAHQHETGILTVQGENDIVSISLLNGQIVAADSLNQTAEESLGHVLVDQRLVAAADFSAVTAEYQGGSSGSLGDLLVARELISREQLLQALRVQTYRLMLMALGWRRGEYKFYGGDEVFYEQGFLPIPIEELIIRALHDTHQPLPDPRVVYARREPTQEIRVLGREGGDTDTGIWLTQGEIAFLEKINGERTNAAIAQECSLGKYRALHCLYRLWQEGLIEPVGGAPATPPTGAIPAAPPVVTPPPPTRQPVAKAPASSPSDPFAHVTLPPPRPVETVLEEPSTLYALDRDQLAMGSTLLGPVIAAVLVVLLAVLIWWQPSRVLLPFPWQRAQRTAFESLQQLAASERIDRSARTWFLLAADYPDSLEELVASDLLASSDLDDPRGRRLRYVKGMLTYQLVPIEDDEAVEELGRDVSINDDFLLDPDFLPEGASGNPALYLID